MLTLTAKSPKVFISHASEDKTRFVLTFATRLRSNGVDAWLDKWEMLPGDSLVDKIFNEGIGGSDVVLIVLSQFSVTKPWVREEINASFVQRIRGKLRIIPVVIDECEIPNALQSILFERISDLSNYDDSLHRILSSIFEFSVKPTLGSPPPFVKLNVDKIPGLNPVDTLIFKLACELTLQSTTTWVRSGQLKKEMQKLGISDEQVLECIEILEDRSLIKVTWIRGGELSPFMLTTRGFETYGKYFIDDFNSLITNTLLAILNKRLRTNGDVAELLSKSPIFAAYILDILDARKYIRVVKTAGDDSTSVIVTEVTTQGKRFASQTR